jgi:hypothetical protein
MQGAVTPLRGLVAASLVTIAAFGAAQDHALRLIQESYFQSGSGMHGLQQQATWTELHANLSSNYSAVLSDFHYGNDGMLDEDYLQFDGKAYALRAGRMRSAFGFGTWSDTWYNPVFSLPISRFMPLAGNINLSNFNSGVEARLWNGPIQGEVAILNQNPAEEQILPGRMDFDRARLQVDKGSLILGLNALAQNGEFAGNKPRALGLDYRYTAPRLVFRGEAMEGFGQAGNAKGFYTDATYRPPRFFRTQLGARIEGYRDDADFAASSLFTLGARQIVSPNLALTLNYSWGNVPDFLYSMRGWHLQAALGVRFE